MTVHDDDCSKITAARRFGISPDECACTCGAERHIDWMSDEERALLPPYKDSAGTWLAERCKSNRCRGFRVTVGFSVSDEDWVAVTGKEDVLCLSCFDAMAQQKGINYTVLNTFVVGWDS